MKVHALTRRCLLFVLLCAAFSPLLAQEAGEAVRIQGALAQDVYAAGGTVDVLATVEGDVVVAGGRVSVSERVSGDVIAAGGTLSVRADVGDDVRAAGGDVTLSGSVGDDAIAAGGNVTLTPDATVNGRAWFSGGRVDVAGAVGGELKAAGGQIVLSGRVKGNALLRGRTIRILDSAIIDGDLVYHSPREAEIASGAQIRGTITHEPVEQTVGAAIAAVGGGAILMLLSLIVTGGALFLMFRLIVTGGALFLMFPRVIETALTTVRAEPWKSLALGLAVFAATPVVISVLFVTVIGWLPALVIGALYLILLLVGFLTGVFYAGNLGLGRRGPGEVTRARRLWSFVVALIVVTLLGLVPVIGQLVLLALMLLGVGALTLGMNRAYQAA